MEVVDWRAIIVLFSVRQRFLRCGSEVWYMLLRLVEVVSIRCHRVNIDAVETAVMGGIVIEVLSIVVMIHKVTVLVLAKIRTTVQIARVVVRILLVVNHMMLHVKSLNVVIVNDVVVCCNMLHVRNVMDHGMLVVRRHVSNL
jgi:hypothetical protein